jgi:hypothetical protein
MNFTRDDMLNIRSCIKRRGTKSQREALSRWQTTGGYICATRQCDKFREWDQKEISRLKTNESYTKHFIERHGLLGEFNKEKEEYFEKEPTIFS